MNRELALDKLLDLWDNRTGGLRRVKEALDDLSCRRKIGITPFGGELPRKSPRAIQPCGMTKKKEFIGRVIALRRLGWSHNRIAEEMKCSRSTVGNTLDMAAGVYRQREREIYGKSAYFDVDADIFDVYEE